MKAGTKGKKTAALFLVCVLFMGFTVFADGIENEISQTQSVMDENEELLASTQERIALLEASKNSSEAYLAELVIQLGELNDELGEIDTRLAEKEKELNDLQKELASIRQLADEQYEAMKIRIRFLYENGASAGAFVSIFSADSFTEFINRAENYGELNRYDREMLTNYEDTLQSIEEHESELITEKEQILQIQQELYIRRNRIQELYQAAYNDMNAYLAELDSTMSEQDELVEELNAAAERMNDLLRQQYEEEAARALEAQRIAEEEALRAELEAQAQAQAMEEAEAADAGGEEEQEQPGDPDEQPEEPFAEDAALDEDPAEEDFEEEASEEAPGDEPAEVPEDNPQEEPEGSGEPSDMTYLGNFTLTAYCPCTQCCGPYATGHTASGTLATAGVTVAMGGVDFGTQLYINGHVYTVEDRGTAYGHVDIFFDSHEDALAFGMQYADVYVVN